MRSADASSSARYVASRRTRRSSRLCARKTTRSSVERSAQCRSSSTSSTGRGRRPLGEQGERLLEHPQLRAGAAPELAERRQGVDERLVGQLRADEVDRASEQDLEACGACSVRDLGREPGLADPCFTGDEGAGAASRLRLAERAPKRLELACASDERRACPASIAPRRDRVAARYARERRKIRHRARCAIAAAGARSPRRDEHPEASDVDCGDEAAGSHCDGRRRAAAARAGVGKGGRPADPAHPRVVAEPSLLGPPVRERAGRGVPAGGLRPAWPRHVRGAARA